METEKGLFFVYLRERGKAIACLCLFTGIFAGTFLLYRVPWQAAAYPAALCLGLGCCGITVGSAGFTKPIGV